MLSTPPPYHSAAAGKAPPDLQPLHAQASLCLDAAWTLCRHIGSAQVAHSAALQSRLQCVRGDDSRLPVAHTCTRVVDLPAYSSQAALAKQLATALQHAEGGFHVL
jgi:hypothetical protein